MAIQVCLGDIPTTSRLRRRIRIQLDRAVIHFVNMRVYLDTEFRNGNESFPNVEGKSRPRGFAVHLPAYRDGTILERIGSQRGKPLSRVIE